MTEKQPPIVVAAEEINPRLEALLASYDSLKAKADEAAAQLKAVTDAIKHEVHLAHAESVTAESRFDITSKFLAAPLRLSYVESWRLDAKRLKVEDPATYVTYAVKSGSWQLRKAAG